MIIFFLKELFQKILKYKFFVKKKILNYDNFQDACQNVDCKYGEECRGGQCICSFHCPSKPAESQRVCGEGEFERFLENSKTT